MYLDAIKKEIFHELNCFHTFFYRGMRNQNEKFQDKIIQCFPSIFIIETVDGLIKAFSYSDYIIKNIIIIS